MGAITIKDLRTDRTLDRKTMSSVSGSQRQGQERVDVWMDTRLR